MPQKTHGKIKTENKKYWGDKILLSEWRQNALEERGKVKAAAYTSENKENKQKLDFFPPFQPFISTYPLLSNFHCLVQMFQPFQIF